MASNLWGADGPVSTPAPPEDEVMLSFGGFGFTAGGMVHDITEADLDEVFSPIYGPGE